MSAPVTRAKAPLRQLPRQVPRLATIGAVLAVLALSVVADRSRPGQPRAAAFTGMPVAAPAAALSSSWYCAGPVGSPARLADGHLVIANSAPQPLRGQVTLIPSNGPPTTSTVEVDGASEAVVPENVAAGTPFLGAVVELDGGQAVVQQVVTGSEGTSRTSCATSGSTSWFFPSGTTQESSALSLSLLNPYANDAIADLSFTTEQGQENPQDFQGIVIPARSVVGLDIGSHLRLRASIATTVTLRVGRVTAFETEAVQAQSAAAVANQAPGTTVWPPGVTLVRGAATAATTWWWPSGVATDGQSEQYVIYNPRSATARVSLQVDLDQGGADPFQVSVDPHGVAVVATNSESRIPKGIGHAAVLRSLNGVGVVAGRLVQSTRAAGPTALASVPGSQMEARRWLAAADGTSASVNPELVVYNPGSTPVRVAISSVSGSVTPLDGQGDVIVAGHHRYVLPGASGASAPLASAALQVDANGPVVVEYDLVPTRGIGFDAALAVPLA